MANSYDLNLTDGTLDITVDEKEVVVDHGLTFTGRGVEDYGQHRNTNLLHLAENFASATAPTNPLTGQVWFNTTGGSVNIFDGVSFGAIGSDDFVISGIYPVGNVSPNEVNLPKNLTADVIVTGIAEWTDFDDHLTETTSAHLAAGVVFTPAGNISSTDVQAAIIELQDTELENHINDATAAHAGTAISVTPVGDITSTNVQAAISEIENDIDVTIFLNNVVQTAVNNHIADAVDAHNATAISYDNSSSGLVAIEVQAAIDEIALNGTSGGGSGYVDCVRVTINSNQSIDGGAGGGALGVAETLEFDTIVDGDSLGNFNTGNFRYEADRPMQIRVRAYARYEQLNDNQVGYVRIRKNGANVRHALQLKLASSVAFADQTMECSWIDDLATNDWIDIQAQLQSFGPSSNKNVFSGRIGTGFEVEVLTDLTP